MKKYDIIIVGAGASGVFMSYELAKLDIDASVLMLDNGAPLEKRQCPIKKGAGNCLKCEPCHIMNGYGGAGTLSDGKYNITTQFGGDLHNYVGTEEAMDLMEYVDQVLCSMGCRCETLFYCKLGAEDDGTAQQPASAGSQGAPSGDG